MHTRSWLVVAPVLSLVMVLAGCGSSHKGVASRTSFTLKADGICKAINLQVATEPSPTTTGQLTSELKQIATYYASYYQEEHALVIKQSDSATLQAKWLTPSKAIFTAQEALADKLLAALNAGDTSAAQKDQTTLSTLDSSQDAAVVSYLKGYGGLTDCATLQSSSAS